MRERGEGEGKLLSKVMAENEVAEGGRKEGKRLVVVITKDEVGKSSG